MMKENYKIRLINKDEVERFVQIFRESFKTEYLIPSIYRGLGIENFILNELNNPLSPYRYFGLFYNDKLIGCAEYKIINKDTVFLNLIASDNEFKGKGVGKAIINKTFEYYSKKGYNKVQLDVYEGNDIALNWYNSLGFIELNKKSIYKLDNALLEEEYSIYILNFPQYRKIVDTFGFYYIEVAIDDTTIRLGVINNDLIIRGEFNQYSRLASKYILKVMNFNCIYYVGDCDRDETELTFMNNILRMELNLKG
ncbi:MAG: GNAT family N-acetyltransferase [Bacteroidales bacterium]